MRMLDLFAGNLGWGMAFLAQGWKVDAVDIKRPSVIPPGVDFICENILCIGLGWDWERRARQYDFIWASSPCEEFSAHGMKHFFPNPKYPANGIELFNHTRALCESSGVPYLMENVRAAQQFVGNAVNHCGPFYLWGSGVPPLLPQGIIKGMTRLALGYREHKGKNGWNTKNIKQERRQKAIENAGVAATIPPELAKCVADYAKAITERASRGA